MSRLQRRLSRFPNCKTTAGGHFAAFEQPDRFVEEVKAGIGSLPD